MGAGCGSACLPFGVSAGAGVCRIQDLQVLPRCWLWSSCRVFLPFCPLPRFALGALIANVALFRILKAFLEGFTVQMYVCMGLGICVACVAFVRVSG